ncbi:hypothetical protein [Symbiobacterium terraclitae]|uniref:hypothetical protein n=1 Tax=Symbiobacterium terraclitae TaxID=557451 RepID=UPI0035B536AA
MGQERAQVPAEIVAVITAAISAALDQPPGTFAIRAIEPAGVTAGAQGPYAAGTPGAAALAAASGWSRAGVVQAHLTRAQFGGRTR